jgi:hypothetical protein
LQGANGGGAFPGAFVTKLNAAGSALLFSVGVLYSNFAYSSGAYGQGIAVDGAGSAYVTGWFRTVNDFYGNLIAHDAFVAKVQGPTPLIYTAPAGASHSLLLGRDGPTLRLMDNGALVASRPLADTAGVLVYGADNQPDSLTLDNSAGLITLSDGVRFDGGAGGGNTAFLVGTPGGDTFTLTPTGFSLDGALTGAFVNVQSVTAFGGPADAASLYDSPGNDLFVATPTYAYVQAGASLNIVSGFARVQAGATAGSDLALLYDSAGSDVFTGTPGYASLAGAGFYNLAVGFAEARGNASGGADVALLYDSAGDDVFRSTPGYSFLGGPGYLNLVIGFSQINAKAGGGGSDSADLYDTPGNDTFSGQGSIGTLTTPSYSVTVNRFGFVRATSGAGGFDQLFLGAIDYVFAQVGAWH